MMFASANCYIAPFHYDILSYREEFNSDLRQKLNLSFIYNNLKN